MEFIHMVLRTMKIQPQQFEAVNNEVLRSLVTLEGEGWETGDELRLSESGTDRRARAIVTHVQHITVLSIARIGNTP